MWKEKSQKVFQKKTTKTSQWVHKSEKLFQDKFCTEKVSGVDLPLHMTAGTLQLPAGSWQGTERVGTAELALAKPMLVSIVFR